MNYTHVVAFDLRDKTDSQRFPPPPSVPMTLTFSYHLGIYFYKSTLISSCWSGVVQYDDSFFYLLAPGHKESQLP